MKNKAIEDKVVEDKVVEDKVVEDKVVEDKVVEDKVVEDKETNKINKVYTVVSNIFWIIVLVSTVMILSNTGKNLENRGNVDNQYIVHTVSELTGIDIITDRSPMRESRDEVKRFSKNMVREIDRRRQDLNNGVLLRRKMRFIDIYGNITDEEDGITVYISQNTLDKINYETWPHYQDYYIYSIADEYWIHEAERDNLKIPYEK